MVIIAGAVQVAKTAWRFRKQIYKGLVAQDKLIGYGWKKGGYSKWTSAGVRHGAIGGSVAGLFIKSPDYISDDAIQENVEPAPTSPFTQARNRRTRRYSRGYKKQCRPCPRRNRRY